MTRIPVFPVPFASYAEPPRFGAKYCRSIARALLNQLPGDASVDEKKAIKLVVELGESVTSVVTEREKAGVGKVRPSMLAFTNAWGGTFDVVSGFVRFGGAVGDDARALVDTLFVEGVAFVKLDANAAWSEGLRRLERLDDEGLARKLASLIGEAQVAAIRAATAQLGNAIGTGTEQRDVPSSTALAEKLTLFSHAVASYCRIAAAKVDVTDGDSVARFLKQMSPIDEYRASRKTASDEEDEETVVTNDAPSPIPASPSPSAPVNGV